MLNHLLWFALTSELFALPSFLFRSVSVDAKLSVWKALLDTHNEPGVLERLLQLVVLRLTTTGVTQSLVDNLQAPRSLPTGTSGEAHASDVAREPADQENEVKEHQDVSVAVAARSDTALSEEHEVNHEDLTDSSAQANHMARRQQLQAAETAEQHRNHGQGRQGLCALHHSVLMMVSYSSEILFGSRGKCSVKSSYRLGSADGTVRCMCDVMYKTEKLMHNVHTVCHRSSSLPLLTPCQKSYQKRCCSMETSWILCSATLNGSAAVRVFVYVHRL